MAERKMSEAAPATKIPIPAASFRESLRHRSEQYADKQQQRTTHLESGSLPLRSLL